VKLKLELFDFATLYIFKDWGSVPAAIQIYRHMKRNFAECMAKNELGEEGDHASL